MEYIQNLILDLNNETKNRHIEFLRLLPNDQYVCPECKEVPEILNIDYENDYNIELKCKNHKEVKIPIEKYFEKEENHLYINEICGKDKTTIQRNYNHCLFDFCKGCNIYLCGACSRDHPHQSSFIKINEYNNMCKIHCQKYINYCIDCQKHLCKACMNKRDSCSHPNLYNLEEKDQKQDEENIKILIEERERLIKAKNLIEHLIKFIETILTTYFKHTANYFHYININNLANSITFKNNYKLNRELLIAKLDDLERLARHYLNVKLKIELTGNELSINLNNKNLTNIDFQILSEINFKKAESMHLNHNNISDITSLKNLKSPNLKFVDLSFNKINNINSFKDFSKKEQKIETILLNNNEINNADIFKVKIFPFIKEINLDENNLLAKDIQEIKDVIKGIKRIKKKKFNFNKMNNNFREETKKETKKKENLKLPLIRSYSFSNFQPLTINIRPNHH
jgi:hypothetical protein